MGTRVAGIEDLPRVLDDMIDALSYLSLAMGTPYTSERAELLRECDLAIGRAHSAMTTPQPDPAIIGSALERLAALEHQRWSDYLLYLLNQCFRDAMGNLVIPTGYAQALRNLAETPYHLLPEEQKEKDRIEARKSLAIINKGGTT